MISELLSQSNQLGFAQVDEVDGTKHTRLMQAARAGEAEVVRNCLMAGADPVLKHSEVAMTRSFISFVSRVINSLLIRPHLALLGELGERLAKRVRTWHA